MAPTLAFSASDDGRKWTNPAKVANGESDYGVQMANFRGELYGIVTLESRKLAATKFKVGSGWKDLRPLPDLYKAKGRVGVTVLDDKFYVVYRSSNDHTYMIWTSNFEDWHNAGRVGSKYAETKVAPAIQAYQGLLFITGVGPDKYIYYTIFQGDGSRVQSWKKIDGTGTQSALAMGVRGSTMYLFHTAYNNGKFFYQSYEPGNKWSKLASTDASEISSGLSVSNWKYDGLVITYKGDNSSIKYQGFTGEKWTGISDVTGAKMQYQTGLATFAGNIIVSYGVGGGDSSKVSSGYRMPAMMSEKSLFVSEEEVGDWDCKWNEPKENKSFIKKFFCL